MLFKTVVYLWFFSLNGLSCPCSVEYANDTLLQTLNGNVQGVCNKIEINYARVSSILNPDVITWLSIPYAEPPINANRFKAPVPVRNWTNTRDGTVNPKSCLQQFHLISDEDCLYLNIYSSAKIYKNRATTLKPILVFIHGASL